MCASCWISSGLSMPNWTCDLYVHEKTTKVMKSMQRKKWHEANLHLFNDIRFTKLLFRHFCSGSVCCQMKFKNFFSFFIYLLLLMNVRPHCFRRVLFDAEQSAYLYMCVNVTFQHMPENVTFHICQWGSFN